VRLLASFEILDVWEMATPEHAQEKKDEWNRAKKEFIKNFTHGRKPEEPPGLGTCDIAQIGRGGGME
jgi:hypothetical protein